MARTLSEYESKQLLRSYGVPVVPEALVRDPEDAILQAAKIGFPVVLKLCGAGIAHKTERDLVRLGLTDAEQVRAAAVDLLARRTREESDAELLVQAMIRGRREIIAGMFRDPQFGPCVMLGFGGIFAEVMAEVVFRMAPIDGEDARDMISELKATSFFGPFRGEAAADGQALAAVLMAVGRVGLEDDQVLSLDLNPLIIASAPFAGGVIAGTPVAVDALVEVAGP